MLTGFFFWLMRSKMCPQEQEPQSSNDQCNWKKFLPCILNFKSQEEGFYCAVRLLVPKGLPCSRKNC